MEAKVVRTGDSRTPRKAMIVASAATASSGLPAFVTSVNVVQLTGDLAFGVAGLGLAISIYYAVGAVSAMHLGRFVDRFGASLSLKLSMAGTAAAALGIAVTARNWLSLLGWLVVSGAAHALTQPAANRMLVNRVSAGRLGTAFGIKQSAPPLGSMLAGLSVPLVALTVGWRWAYVLVAGLAIATMVAIPRPATKPGGTAPKARRTPLRDRPTIVVLTLAFACGFGANSVILAFYVDSVVQAGSSQELAGTTFAMASVGAILMRVTGGVVADRTKVRPMRLSAGLVGTGSVGLVLLSTGQPGTMAIGGLVALAFTWGFPGVFWLALVRAYPEAPGRITGALAPGGFGAVLAPLGFGLLVEHQGYGVAWLSTAVLALLAAAVMFVGAQRLADPRNA